MAVGCAEYLKWLEHKSHEKCDIASDMVGPGTEGKKQVNMSNAMARFGDKDVIYV